jgi:hypothetical protein
MSLRAALLVLGVIIFPSISLAQQKDAPPPITPEQSKQLDEARRNTRREDCMTRVPSIDTGSAALNEMWTVGASVTAQLARYNLSTEKASINEVGLGAGIALRYYPKGWMDVAIPEGMTDPKKIDELKDIRRIKPDCRASTFEAATLDADPQKGKIAFPLFSISPTVFIAKQEDSSDVSVQPALVVGFVRDIVSIGIGFNLTGPGRGDVFILFGLGAGFRF